MSLPLPVLQQQLLAAITGFATTQPGSAPESASNHPASNHQVTAQLAAAAHLSPAQSLAIYQYGYRARLLDCLRAEFPVLRIFLGHALFDRFAMEYLSQTPSRATTLFQLGAAFPGYLQASCPDLGTLDAAMQAHCRLPIELAQLERLRMKALRAAGPESAPPFEPDYQNLPLLGQLRPHAPATLGLLRSCHDLPGFYQALRTSGGAGQVPPEAEVKECHIAVARNHYRLNLHRIAPWQSSLLARLVTVTTTLEAGQAAQPSAPMLAELLAVVADEQKIALPELQARLPFWLPLAVARGYLMFVLPEKDGIGTA